MATVPNTPRPLFEERQLQRDRLYEQYKTGFGGRLSEKRAWQRYLNRIAQLDAIEKQKARQELYREKTRQRVADRKFEAEFNAKVRAEREARAAAKAASPAPAAAPAAAPAPKTPAPAPAPAPAPKTPAPAPTPAASAPTSAPQSTQSASPVKPPAPQPRQANTPPAAPQSQPMDMSKIVSMLRDMAMMTPTAQLNALQRPAAPAGPTREQVAQQIARIKHENRDAPDFEALDRELANMIIDEQEAYDARNPPQFEPNAFGRMALEELDRERANAAIDAQEAANPPQPLPDVIGDEARFLDEAGRVRQEVEAAKADRNRRLVAERLRAQGRIPPAERQALLQDQLLQEGMTEAGRPVPIPAEEQRALDIEAERMRRINDLFRPGPPPQAPSNQDTLLRTLLRPPSHFFQQYALPF